jgi:dephospho-CoA kinase
MLVVGLTGGIGSGKSTFAALLAERGAQVIDADSLGRDALRPDEPAWHSVVGQFGDEILAAGSMEVDRKRLARIVFADRRKLAALNAIVHPVIVKGIADTLDRLASSDAIVILDAALILETGLDSSVDVLIAVVAQEGVRRKRLARDRAMSPGDISARMSSQLGTEELASRADVVVRNNGSLEDLATEAARVWAHLEDLRDGSS